MELKTTLNGEMTRRYEIVKKHTGLKDDKNLLAFLISEEYGRIQSADHRRIFVANKTYSLVEKSAEAHGQTVEQYVADLIESEVKKAEEGAKHGNLSRN